MPVRIYDIARKLGLPNKVVLEKAKELGIAAARAASCSLDKITAEFLEQQLPQPGAAEQNDADGKKARKTAQKEKSPKKSPTGEEKSDVPSAETEVQETAPVAEPAETVASPEPVAPAVVAEPMVSEPTEEVPDSVLQEVESFVQQGLEELSSGAVEYESSRGRFQRSGKRAPAEQQPSKPEPKVEQVETPPAAPQAPVPTLAPIVLRKLPVREESAQPVAPSNPPPPPSESTLVGRVVLPPQTPRKGKFSDSGKRKDKTGGQGKRESQSPKQTGVEPRKSAAPAATSPAPKPAPVFGLKQIWKMPISAISRRLAGEKEEEPASAGVKEKSAADGTASAPEVAKLGQKVGFIQLPQKSAPSKPADKQSKGKDGKRGDRGGKDRSQQQQSSQQQGQQQQQQQRSGLQQQRPGGFQQQRGGFQQQRGGFQQQRGGFQQRGTGQFRGPGQQQFQRPGGGFGQQGQGRQQQGGGRGGFNKPAALQRGNKGADKQIAQQRTVPKEPLIKVAEGAELITMKAPVVVRQLAEVLNRKPFQLIADLMEVGVFANVNQSIEESVASKLCAKYGFRFELEKRDKGGALVKGDQKKVEIAEEDDRPEDMKPRPPVVTIMGHVDHGKTTLLDAIRKSDVVSSEAGGITQHIGAYTISIPHPERPNELQQITFLDTPGHEAFSAMRARGANVTDIVILVVAANDGVMPQTVEAIRHAQAAKVTIMVAVNKCDLPGANTLKARQQLQDYGLLCEEWGGNTIFVDVSALTKKGVDDLLGLLILQAEVLELKANPNRKAKGNVVESGLAPGGPTATVLVRKGSLKLGDAILCGEFYGKARALINEEGQRLKKAGPSEAVKLLGLNGVPEAGTEFQVVENEKMARDMAEEQRQQNRDEGNRASERPVTLEGFLENFSDSDNKLLKVIVKGDTQVSVEAIVDALKKIKSDKVNLEIIHSAVGPVTESDIILASASKAIVIGFHTRVDALASEIARREGVQIKLYSIIYELIGQVRDAMAGLLDPILKEVPLGQAEVRQVFNLSKAGSVAGCMVTQGKVARGRCRVIRGNETLFEGSLQSLRHFHDEVSELKTGMEGGIRVDGFHDYKEGDIIQSYAVEKIVQQL